MHRMIRSRYALLLLLACASTSACSDGEITRDMSDIQAGDTLQKSEREVFTDPVVQYGYARGLEPVTYVQKILDRYRHYQQFVAEQPGALADAR